MAFVPRYQEAAEPVIVDNIMAVIDRDMKPALDYFDQQAHGGIVTDNLPGFAVMTDGAISVFNYPILVLGVQRMGSVETDVIDEGNYLDQTLTVGAGLIVNDTQSLKKVKEKARKYVRAFKAVIRSAAISDLLPSTARVLNHSIEINHVYLEPTNKGAEFEQRIAIEIRLKFGES